MVGGRLGECVGLDEEVIKKACNLAMKAHHSLIKSAADQKPYLCERSRGSKEAIFAFPGTWSVGDWFSSGKPFGETKVNASLFPSLKSIGMDEPAAVNEAFSCRFEQLLGISQLEREVEKATMERKKVVFTGHSSGGPIAMLAALWVLEKGMIQKSNLAPPFCVTFGAPLAGDRIFSHALRRENWDQYFIHFVTRYDIIPRVLLAPVSLIERDFQQILPHLCPKSPQVHSGSIDLSSNPTSFFMTVMRNASAVASHAACHLMGCTNLLLETVSSFVELSPYRPFGTYVFGSQNGQLLVVQNPDAVLQMLFYSAQLSSETEMADIVRRSLTESLAYENCLQDCLEMQHVVCLSNLVDLPLSSNACTSNEALTLNAILNEFGLGSRARLSLRAAGELERQKMKNQVNIDGNKDIIRKGLNEIQAYQMKCEVRKVGYYDAFKLQKDVNDFNANVKRLELAGIWDETIEMLQRCELPDSFEGRKEWIELGTRFRRLVEPLDIANYYRHLKHEDTGPYMMRGRPKRYRFTQRWLEHAERIPPNSISESCFWAEVEELKALPIEDMKERLVSLEKQTLKWTSNGDLSKDVFLEESTFAKWWKNLPAKHLSESCIAVYMTY
ncbi:OLC1v1012951C1 [Oldenlandia corymbosa var. corymbosa]|uniref:OLC1v1012951C1 n=1 Tax=Oldenlandia corymbosa var. corymbosa TaxID=529605 RepID=A0AAV1DX28_OLDCO|nr:OLC1v1012951C1 [Oldenlandia corymbosa var. corymbosa]